jgi:hypothetical protein
MTEALRAGKPNFQGSGAIGGESNLANRGPLGEDYFWPEWFYSFPTLMFGEGPHSIRRRAAKTSSTSTSAIQIFQERSRGCAMKQNDE